MPIPEEQPDIYEELTAECRRYGATLMAVSKGRSEREIFDLYLKGQKLFGENKANELIVKATQLPLDIEWHLIGHLQRNKVKAVISYVNCIQSLDSLKLWEKINHEASEAGLNIPCLLQIKIAVEESKYGWEFEELVALLSEGVDGRFSSVQIHGVMGMASLTQDEEQVKQEFKKLKGHFDLLKEKHFPGSEEFKVISMGMSGDYRIALAEGSNLIRIGSLLFPSKR